MRYRIPHPDKPGKLMERSETFRLKKDAANFAAALDAGGITAAQQWLDTRRGHTASHALTFGAWFDTYVTQLTGVTTRTRDDYHAIHRRYLRGLDANR